MKDLLTNLIVVKISQYTCKSNYHIVHLKLAQCLLYASYISLKLVGQGLWFSERKWFWPGILYPVKLSNVKIESKHPELCKVLKLTIYLPLLRSYWWGIFHHSRREYREREKHRSQNRKSNTMGLENSTEASRMWISAEGKKDYLTIWKYLRDLHFC